MRSRSQARLPDAVPPLAEMIQRTLARDAETPAIKFEGSWYNWGQLSRDANRVNELLCASGINANAPVVRVPELTVRLPVTVSVAPSVVDPPLTIKFPPILVSIVVIVAVPLTVKLPLTVVTPVAVLAPLPLKVKL